MAEYQVGDLVVFTDNKYRNGVYQVIVVIDEDKCIIQSADNSSYKLNNSKFRHATSKEISQGFRDA